MNFLVVGQTPIKNSQNSDQLARPRLKNDKLASSLPDPSPPILVVKLIGFLIEAIPNKVNINYKQKTTKHLPETNKN